MHPSNKAWAWVVFRAKSAPIHTTTSYQNLPHLPPKKYTSISHPHGMKPLKKIKPYHFSQPFCNWDESTSISIFPTPSTPAREEYQVQFQQRCMLDEQPPVDFPVSPNARVPPRGYRFSNVSASLKPKTSAKVQPKGGNQSLEGFWMKKIQWPGAISINMHQRYMNLFIISLGSWKKNNLQIPSCKSNTAINTTVPCVQSSGS